MFFPHKHGQPWLTVVALLTDFFFSRAREIIQVVCFLKSRCRALWEVCNDTLGSDGNTISKESISSREQFDRARISRVVCHVPLGFSK